MAQTQHTKRIVRDDAFVHIAVDESCSLVTTEWKGYVPSPDYRAILLQVLDVITARAIRSWLSESSRMGVILRSDERWSVETVTPLLISAGLQRVAVVRSMDYFSQTASERMVDATRGKVPYRVEFFNSVAHAEDWLKVELEALV